MSWTKRQFIEQAFEEIGLASYVFDLTSDQMQSALRRLDTMMATWNAKGIRLGYPMPSTPENSDLDTETNVPDSANEAVFMNLGIRLAPGYGKTVSVESKVAARAAYDVLLSRAAVPPQQQLAGTIPAGAGNKRLDDPFLIPPTDPLLVGPDNELEFT